MARRSGGVPDGEAVPHPKATETLNTCFILQAEHGLNASTFTARVVASTEADMHAAVTAALGALKGPLHGGATDTTTARSTCEVRAGARQGCAGAEVLRHPGGGPSRRREAPGRREAVGAREESAS